MAAFRLPVRHETGANHACFSPDGRLFVTSGFDYQLRLHHAGRHQLVAPVLHHTALVEALAFSADGRFLASADAKGLVRVWDLMPRGLTVLAGAVAKPAPLFSPDGRWIVLRDTQDRLHLYETRSGAESSESLFEPKKGNLTFPRAETEEEWRFTAERGAPTDMAWDSTGSFLGVALGTNGARVWDIAANQLVTAVTNVGSVLSVAFAPGGTVLAVGTASGDVIRRAIATGGAEPQRWTSPFPILRLAWSHDGRWLATGGSRAVQVWNAVTGAPHGGVMPVDDILSALEFAPDSRHLLVAAGNNAIEPGSAWLLDLPSLRSVHPPMSHGDGVAVAIYSRTGEWVASGGEDNVVRLWHASTGLSAGPEMRHSGIVNALQFDLTERWQAAGGNDGFLRVWSIPAGDLCGPALPFGRSTPSVLFSPDGDRILACTHSENSWLVSFAPDWSPVDEVERIARGQTALKIGPSGALEQVPPSFLASEFATQRMSNGIFTNAASATAWHESLAQQAEASGTWFSATFYLRLLRELHPDDSELARRLERAQKLADGSSRL